MLGGDGDGRRNPYNQFGHGGGGGNTGDGSVGAAGPGRAAEPYDALGNPGEPYDALGNPVGHGHHADGLDGLGGLDELGDGLATLKPDAADVVRSVAPIYRTCPPHTPRTCGHTTNLACSPHPSTVPSTPAANVRPQNHSRVQPTANTNPLASGGPARRKDTINAICATCPFPTQPLRVV